jgi:hypothetical protein
MAAGKDSGIRKRPGLQGPVDDAFTGSFLCVRPTGKPLHAGPAEMASEALERLAREFPKWLRGDARVKDDVDVTAADIAAHHLILFGDPRSNRLLGRMVKRLPLRWTASSLRIGGRDFEASSNLPALIHPNPLNPAKYVVLNSGHTFGEAEFLGTNALLFPRLGDWGVVERGKGIVASGYFDEGWR